MDPRHAEAYTHLLFDDSSMAEALKKGAAIDKAQTLQAIEVKEKQVIEITADTTRASDQEAAQKLLTELQSLKTEIGTK